jgi:hypothetical protein
MPIERPDLDGIEKLSKLAVEQSRIMEVSPKELIRWIYYTREKEAQLDVLRRLNEEQSVIIADLHAQRDALRKATLDRCMGGLLET